jgi:hypothetical protein
MSDEKKIYGESKVAPLWRTWRKLNGRDVADANAVESVLLSYQYGFGTAVSGLPVESVEPDEPHIVDER